MVKLSTLSSGEEVTHLQILVTFIVSVMASVVAYYVCKWFDRND